MLQEDECAQLERVGRAETARWARRRKWGVGFLHWCCFVTPHAVVWVQGHAIWFDERPTDSLRLYKAQESSWYQKIPWLSILAITASLFKTSRKLLKLTEECRLSGPSSMSRGIHDTWRETVNFIGTSFPNLWSKFHPGGWCLNSRLGAVLSLKQSNGKLHPVHTL